MDRSKSSELEACFSGRKLYGDDFSLEQIEQWYREETEGYADLGNKDLSDYSYQYHALNRIHGFSHLPKKLRFNNVLGFGAAWGHEFEPIIDRIDQLTIIEPSAYLRSKEIGPVKPVYVKPRVDGKLEFEDNSFDLATSLGALHHVPNVSFVLSEIIRVLKPGGILLMREPVNSMGDWTSPRPGLTRNERGIPRSQFQRIFREQHVDILSSSPHFTMTYQMNQLFGKILKKPLLTYGFYIRFDRFLSFLLQGNVTYHAERKIQRIAPSSIYYVVRKR
jgi:SAM-dependent methyltransferase